MDERINKPRVFISHSKKNLAFIDKLASDLRKFDIEPWIDTEQIRHGKSWQDAIFKYGLPTCDAVIVYLTELSIQSKMVRKEIDVALLQTLSDNNVAFLPYVSDEKLRVELRPDIRALQVLEWNDENYQSLLPAVIAEIWRSYLERVVSSSIQNERLKRVETELELEKYRSQDNDIFTRSENREFEYISNVFDKKIPFKFVRHFYKRGGGLSQTYEWNCHLHLISYVSLLGDFIGRNSQRYLASDVAALIDELTESEDLELTEDSSGDDRISGLPDFEDELLTHGLLEKFSITTTDEYRSEHLSFRLVVSAKYYRYRYWLAYFKNFSERIIVDVDNITPTIYKRD